MRNAIRPEFVEFIPRVLDDGVLYISREYATAAHQCCCGCGQRVVTPLSPAGWRIRVRGERVTLYPSIGNWSFPCRSHYWIRRNRVVWSYQMSDEEIEAGRGRDARARDEYVGSAVPGHQAPEPPIEREEDNGNVGFWGRVKKWLFG